MFDPARLAVQTDSTRLVTVIVYQVDDRVNLERVTEATHPLTRHGQRPEKLEQLRRIEEAQFRELARLRGGLAGTAEAGGSLLDRTAVRYGTCLGNANAHSNTNPPVLMAGGGFRHAGHLGFDRERNYPMPNLFVSLLGRLGVGADRFASSTGTMPGLDSAG
jgi:hypothetical protein